MVVTYGEPKKGYLNFTLGNLWATQTYSSPNLATLEKGLQFLLIIIIIKSKIIT